MAEITKLKRAVIKEEYVSITGDFIKAVLLNQFVYWSERVKDFDTFIEQENKRALDHGLTQQDITGGWLYKTAEELSEETMLGLSVASMRTHIKALIDFGYISERNNPKYKWDRTKQYRVNLVEIAKALSEKGYNLEGYKIELPFLKIKNGALETKNGNNENSNAIPDTITDITSDINNKKKESKKVTQPRSTNYKHIIDENIKDEEIKDLIWEFIKMRQMKKKPLTDFALKRQINKLFKLSTQPEEQKAIIEKTIVKNWDEFYSLNQSDKQATKQPKEQNSELVRKHEIVL